MQRLLTVILACLGMIGALAIDTYLPSMPAIGVEFDVGPVAVEAVRLVEGTLVPVQAEPLHALEDRLRHLIAGAVAVGILDTEHEHPALLADVEPVEERGAGASDVEVAGGAGCEA